MPAGLSDHPGRADPAGNEKLQLADFLTGSESLNAICPFPAISSRYGTITAMTESGIV